MHTATSFEYTVIIKLALTQTRNMIARCIILQFIIRGLYKSFICSNGKIFDKLNKIPFKNEYLKANTGFCLGGGRGEENKRVHAKSEKDLVFAPLPPFKFILPPPSGHFLGGRGAAKIQLNS